jgi:hypothetical protein
LFVISNESSYANAHTLFLGWRPSRRHRARLICDILITGGIARLGGNAHLFLTCNFLEQQK